MRPVWSGTIAFGLVTVPIKLYAAVESSREVSFHLLDRETLTPIKEVRVNPETGHEVPWNRVVRGVEVSKRRYLPLSPEELAALPLPSVHTIDLFSFVEAGEVDPLLFDTAYYVAAGEGGAKAYELLRDTLERLGTVGVGKLALRTREHLAVLRPHRRILVLHTVYFSDEVREGSAVPGVPERVQVRAGERRMAEQLIKSMTARFEYAAYKSEYKQALDKLIKAKLRDKALPAPAAPRGKVVDLQEALRRSLAASRPRAGRRPRTRRLKAAG